MARKTVGELQDELKRKDERIEELRQEIDEQRDLISRLRESAEDYSISIEQWCEAFDMVPTEDGGWTAAPFWLKHNELVEDYRALARDWNKYLPLINREPRNVGRPLAASEAQCVEVLKLHKQGRSLRGIADDTSLGLNTVRTIVAQKHNSDRTTRKHRQRIERVEIDRQQVAKWKRQKRSRDSLRRRASAFLKESRALVQEARASAAPSTAARRPSARLPP
jgi:hypothetical protein